MKIPHNRTSHLIKSTLLPYRFGSLHLIPLGQFSTNPTEQEQIGISLQHLFSKSLKKREQSPSQTALLRIAKAASLKSTWLNLLDCLQHPLNHLLAYVKNRSNTMKAPKVEVEKSATPEIQKKLWTHLTQGTHGIDEATGRNAILEVLCYDTDDDYIAHSFYDWTQGLLAQKVLESKTTLAFSPQFLSMADTPIKTPEQFEQAKRAVQERVASFVTKPS